MQGSNVELKSPSLEAGFIQQVECWINIGLNCVDIQPVRRATIGQIMHFLETEITVCMEHISAQGKQKKFNEL